MNELTLRQKICASIFLLYALPILILSAYSLIEDSSFSWSLFSLGLLVSSVGSLFFFFLIKQLEEETLLRQPKIALEEASEVSFPSPFIPEATDDVVDEEEAPIQPNGVDQEMIDSFKVKISDLQKQVDISNSALESRQEDLQKTIKEKKDLQRNLDLTIEDLSSYKKTHEKLFQQQEVLLQEYQRTIEDQRTTLDKKEQQVHLMENKIRDLNYEIKTLLHIAELHTQSSHESWNDENSIADELELDRDEIFSPSSETKRIKSPGEAALLLKRSIDNAQKIASAYHFAKGTARFRDLPVDHYALELRRLFDSLREETHGTIIVFSINENKLLFVNQQIKHLLGWGVDKFAQDFMSLIADGHFQWKNAIAQMPPKTESQFQLVFKNKGSQDRTVNCHLGIIPFGIFKDLIIGILF